MEIQAFNYFHGRDKDGVAILNEERSGVFIIGLFMEEYGIAVIVVKMFADYEQFYVVDAFGTQDRKDKETAKLKLKEFTNKYKVKHFLGNKIANIITNKKPSFGCSSGTITEGFESLELSPLELFFIAEEVGEKAIILNHIKNDFDREFRSFDIGLVRTKSKTYPRTAALAIVSRGVNLKYNGMIAPQIPDITLDRETMQIISNPEDELPPGHVRINRNIY